MTGILSRSNRYLVAIGGLAVLALLLVALAYRATDSAQAAVDAEAQRLAQLRGLAAELSDAVNDQQGAIHDFLLAIEAESIDEFEAAVAAEAQVSADLLAAAQPLRLVQHSIDNLTGFTSRWRETFAVPGIAAARDGRSAIDEFLRMAPDDHHAFHTAFEPLNEALQIAESDLSARDEDLARSRTIATAFGLAVMLLAAALALVLIRRYGKVLERDALRAGVVNRFTEVTSFATDDTAISKSNLEALALLTNPDAAVTHVLNYSKDRAVPEAVHGDAIAEVLPLGGLAHCAGLVRGSMYVTSDAAAPLSVHCPVYNVARGTVACVPLVSGETVGAVHLYWERPNALPLDLNASVVRIAEHAALAIGNRRLLAALQGQANTDPRTGLPNTRAFDRAVEDALSALTVDERLSVLMLDLDFFKDFNDRYGHPGGDEALRAFAGVLRSCMRDGDLAARYGGEEFAVFLPGVDAGAAEAIAERIRARTESTVISLAPGQNARITVSIGIATAPDEASDRVTLLRIADQALYISKSTGRNRITASVGAPAIATIKPKPAARRRSA